MSYSNSHILIHMELQHLIQTASALGAQMALEAVGKSAGTMTERQAIKLHGQWFKDAVKAHRIFPCKVGKGEHGVKWYSIQEILLLKTTDMAKAEIVWK